MYTCPQAFCFLIWDHWTQDFLHISNSSTRGKTQHYLRVVVWVLLHWPVTKGIPESPEASKLWKPQNDFEVFPANRACVGLQNLPENFTRIPFLSTFQSSPWSRLQPAPPLTNIYEKKKEKHHLAWLFLKVPLLSCNKFWMQALRIPLLGQAQLCFSEETAMTHPFSFSLLSVFLNLKKKIIIQAEKYKLCSSWMGKPGKFCSQVLQRSWGVSRNPQFSSCTSAHPKPGLNWSWLDMRPSKHSVVHGNPTARMMWGLLLIFR